LHQVVHFQIYRRRLKTWLDRAASTAGETRGGRPERKPKRLTPVKAAGAGEPTGRRSAQRPATSPQQPVFLPKGKGADGNKRGITASRQLRDQGDGKVASQQLKDYLKADAPGEYIFPTVNGSSRKICINVKSRTGFVSSISSIMRSR
ncbi:hypothetical protein JG688_00017248, partial [Phytophthora aleatoria]